MGTHTTTLEDIGRVFNEGHYREALQMSESLNGGNRPRRDGAYWSQRAMILLHLNEPKEAASCYNEARKSASWNDQMEMEFKRDLALTVIRGTKKSAALAWVLRELGHEGDAGDTEQVIHFLLQPMLETGDANDWACWLMIVGRFNFSRSRLIDFPSDRRLASKMALGFFEDADEIWTGLNGRANRQWQMNNRYHWFKALRQQNSLFTLLRKRSPKTIDLYSLIQQDDSNERRRTMAKLILFTGRFGLWVESKLL